VQQETCCATTAETPAILSPFLKNLHKLSHHATASERIGCRTKETWVERSSSCDPNLAARRAAVDDARRRIAGLYRRARGTKATRTQRRVVPLLLRRRGADLSKHLRPTRALSGDDESIEL
jgi:hypothetical protein